MKLQQILAEWAKAAIPRELRELCSIYWKLRAKALKILPAMDPYICDAITPQIFKFMKSTGIPVQIHTGEMYGAPIHMWAKIKLPGGNYIVDGSQYQAEYGRSINGIIPGELGRRLHNAGITNLYKLIGVIDTKLIGEQQGFLDDGTIDIKHYDQYQELLTKAATTLTPREVEHIKGRLLPILLHITKEDDKDYAGHKYDPKSPYENIAPNFGEPEPVQVQHDEF